MANEALGTCQIQIGGEIYDRFVSVTLKRSIEELTCSGTIVLSWPGAEAFDANDLIAPQMADGARGQLLMDGQKVATFRIDTRTSSGSATQYFLTLAFRGISSAMIDGQPDHKTGEFNKQTADKIAQQLAEKYESKVIPKTSDVGREIEKFIVSEGEPVERAMRRALRERGLNIVENVDGNLEVTKNESSGSGQAFEIGKNFYEWSTQRDMSVRFKDYKILGNGVVTDQKYGKDNETIIGKAKDPSVPYFKVFKLLSETDHDQESLNKRANYEARRRSAQGLHVTLKLSTWSDDKGKVWELFKDHHVKIPVDTIDGTLRVSALVFTMSATERSTTMTLMSTDAFNDSKKPTQLEDVFKTKPIETAPAQEPPPPAKKPPPPNEAPPPNEPPPPI